jgi:hypothetical protein
MEKICIKCDKTKNVNEFHNSIKSKDGKCSYCKDCMKSYSYILKDEKQKKYDVRKKFEFNYDEIQILYDLLKVNTKNIIMENPDDFTKIYQLTNLFRKLELYTEKK